MEKISTFRMHCNALDKLQKMDLNDPKSVVERNECFMTVFLTSFPIDDFEDQASSLKEMLWIKNSWIENLKEYSRRIESLTSTDILFTLLLSALENFKKDDKYYCELSKMKSSVLAKVFTEDLDGKENPKAYEHAKECAKELLSKFFSVKDSQ